MAPIHQHCRSCSDVIRPFNHKYMTKSLHTEAKVKGHKSRSYQQTRSDLRTHTIMEVCETSKLYTYIALNPEGPQRFGWGQQNPKDCLLNSGGSQEFVWGPQKLGGLHNPVKDKPSHILCPSPPTMGEVLAIPGLTELGIWVMSGGKRWQYPYNYKFRPAQCLTPFVAHCIALGRVQVA